MKYFYEVIIFFIPTLWWLLYWWKMSPLICWYRHSVRCRYKTHDDVIKWKHLPRHWPFVRGIQRSPVDSLHKGQWHGALIFSLISGWTNNRDAGDLKRHRAHYDVTVMRRIMKRFQYYISMTKLQHGNTLSSHKTPYHLPHGRVMGFLWRFV